MIPIEKLTPGQFAKRRPEIALRLARLERNISAAQTPEEASRAAYALRTFISSTVRETLEEGAAGAEHDKAWQEKIIDLMNFETPRVSFSQAACLTSLRTVERAFEASIGADELAFEKGPDAPRAQSVIVSLTSELPPEVFRLALRWCSEPVTRCLYCTGLPPGEAVFRNIEAGDPMLLFAEPHNDSWRMTVIWNIRLLVDRKGELVPERKNQRLGMPSEALCNALEQALLLVRSGEVPRDELKKALGTIARASGSMEANP